MARHGSMPSARGPHGGGGGGGGRGGAMASALQAANAQMDRLRAELLSSLTSVVSDTVDMAFEQHEESFVQAAQAVHQLSGAGGASRGKPSREAKFNGDADTTVLNDYDLFHRCCQRLVDYIDENMATSPDFKQQMDRVVLACHSNASEAVLRSVVTRKLWFHTTDSAANGMDEDDDQRDVDEEEDEVVEVGSKPARGKTARGAPLKAPTRGPKRRTPAPPPPPPVRSANMRSPEKKRARRESASRQVNYAQSEEETEEDEEEEDVQRKRKRRAPRIRYSDDEEEEARNDEDEEDEDVVFVAKSDTTSQPHYGQADELLTFKDAIGDMCYVDRRTTAQTRFFKERLRKAIQFVDAQLCKPPKGKSCTWECAKVRRQMCNRDLPCRNKICRLWHDVEAHTDRCQNSHCEFRIRVMLRETMYKIDHKKMELLGFLNELASKRKGLLHLKDESLSERENFVETRLLENEIDQLESEIENTEKDLGIFKATKKTYWATLNEIGITVEDDANDQFPEFKGHYADKKTPKKKTSTKERNSDSQITSTMPAGRSRSERSRRRQSVDTAIISTSPIKTRERITRRSTQQSLKVLSNGVIELDDDDDDEADGDEEAKTDRSAEYDEDTTQPGIRENVSSVETNNADVVVENEVPDNEIDAEDDASKVERDGGTEDANMDAENDDSTEHKPEPAQPISDANSEEGPQSADYVIESEESKAESNPASSSESVVSSVVDASNHDVDAHVESPTPSSESAAPPNSALGNDNEGETEARVDEDSVPLLPF